MCGGRPRAGRVGGYLGLANELKAALATYTESGGTGRTALDQNEAVALMQEKHEICCALFHGFDRRKWIEGRPAERLALLPAAQEHVLAQEDGKDRCVKAVRELSQAFALAVPRDEALAIRDDVGFFQAVQSALAKRAAGEARSDEELDHAVRQIIDRAVAPEGVTDVFAAAGLPKPDISILSDEFLADVRGMEHRNVAVELLRKLLKGEVATRRRENVVQACSFAKMLEDTLRRYRNRAVEAAQVIEALIELAREMRAANERGEALGLGKDELAFYDALETSDSAVAVLGDEKLRMKEKIANCQLTGDMLAFRHDRIVQASRPQGALQWQDGAAGGAGARAEADGYSRRARSQSRPGRHGSARVPAS